MFIEFQTLEMSVSSPSQTVQNVCMFNTRFYRNLAISNNVTKTLLVWFEQEYDLLWYLLNASTAMRFPLNFCRKPKVTKCMNVIVCTAQNVPRYQCWCSNWTSVVRLVIWIIPLKCLFSIRNSRSLRWKDWGSIMQCEASRVCVCVCDTTQLLDQPQHCHRHCKKLNPLTRYFFKSQL